MKTFLKHLSRLLAIALVLGVSGCNATHPLLVYELWTGGKSQDFNRPASDSQVKAFESVSPRDVLVTYNEMEAKDSRIRRRAFYLHANLERVDSGRQPHFVSLSRTNGLTVLLVTQDGTDTSPAQTNVICQGDISADCQRPSVVTPDGEHTVIQLPRYLPTSATVTRVLLTPLAAVVDALFIASLLVPRY